MNNLVQNEEALYQLLIEQIVSSDLQTALEEELDSSDVTYTLVKCHDVQATQEKIREKILYVFNELLAHVEQEVLGNTKISPEGSYWFSMIAEQIEDGVNDLQKTNLFSLKNYELSGSNTTKHAKIVELLSSFDTFVVCYNLIKGVDVVEEVCDAYPIATNYELTQKYVHAVEDKLVSLL